MIEIRQTAEYESGFDELRDIQAKSRILARIRRLSLGNQKRDIEGAKELARDL